MGALGPDSQAGQAPPATHTSQRWPAARQIHLAGRSTGSLSPLPPWAPSSSTTQGTGSRRRPGDNPQHRITRTATGIGHLQNRITRTAAGNGHTGRRAHRRPGAPGPDPRPGATSPPDHPHSRRQWPPWAPSPRRHGGHLQHRFTRLATGIGHLGPRARGGPGTTCRTGSPAWPPAVATLGAELVDDPGHRIPAAGRGAPAAPDHPPGHRHWPAGHLQHRIS